MARAPEDDPSRNGGNGGGDGGRERRRDRASSGVPELGKRRDGVRRVRRVRRTVGVVLRGRRGVPRALLRRDPRGDGGDAAPRAPRPGAGHPGPRRARGRLRFPRAKRPSYEDAVYEARRRRRPRRRRARLARVPVERLRRGVPRGLRGAFRDARERDANARKGRRDGDGGDGGDGECNGETKKRADDAGVFVPERPG